MSVTTQGGTPSDQRATNISRKSNHRGPRQPHPLNRKADRTICNPQSYCNPDAILNNPPHSENQTAGEYRTSHIFRRPTVEEHHRTNIHSNSNQSAQRPRAPRRGPRPLKGGTPHAHGSAQERPGRRSFQGRGTIPYGAPQSQRCSRNPATTEGEETEQWDMKN